MAGSLLLLGLAVVVEGTSTCPAPSDVAAALEPLLPAREAPAALDHAALRWVDHQLEVELRDAGGALLGARRLARKGACRELAGPAAVVIAAWEAELRPGDVPALSLPSVPADTRTPPPPSVPVAPPPVAVAPSPGPVAPAPVALAVATSAAVERSSSPSPLPASPLRRPGYRVAASFATTWDGHSPSPGGEVEVAIGPRGGHFSFRLAALGFAPRDVSLGPEPRRATWTRPALAAGGRFHYGPGRWQLDAHLDFLAAMLVTDGAGYDTARQDFDFDPGLDAVVRLGLRWRRVTPFLGVGVYGWLRPQQLRAEGIESSPTFDLPRVELLMQLGVAFGDLDG